MMIQRREFRSLVTLKGAALAALLFTSSCNVVATHAPLFAASNLVNSGLKPGVWAAPDASCVFDEKAPLDRWPECASASVVTGRSLEEAPPRRNHPLAKADYVMVDGDPKILQVHIVVPPQKAKQVASFYIYMALRPLKTDASGQITTFTSWIVQCGPLDNQPHGKGASAYSTRKPLAGLVMDRKGANCTTRSPTALRAAALASEAWAAPVQSSHWVRDGGN